MVRDVLWGAEVLGSGDAVTFSLSSGFSATTPPMWVSLGKGVVFAHRHFWTSQCLGPSHCSLLSANVPLLVFFVVLLRKLFPVNPFFTKTLNKDQLWACFLDSPIWYFSEHDFCRHSLVLKDDWQQPPCIPYTHTYTCIDTYMHIHTPMHSSDPIFP